MLNFLVLKMMAMNLKFKENFKHCSSQTTLIYGTELAYRNNFHSFELCNKEDSYYLSQCHIGVLLWCYCQGRKTVIHGWCV